MNIIKQTGTANTTYCRGRRIQYLAVHYTAGVSSKAGSARGCASWFANPEADGSADYIVDEAELVQYNPDPLNRYCHAVGSKTKYNTMGGRLWQIAKNSNCVSLEICSTNAKGKITYPNDPAYSFTDMVLEKAAETVKYLMDLYGIDADHVIRHYDVNGKPCPGIAGWNKDSGSEEKWEAFHAAIGGKPVQWYRVGTDWKDGKCVSQVEADRDLETAKKTADRYGYKVFDYEGNMVYAAKAGSTPATSIHVLPDETAKAAAMLELVHGTDKSGILSSVTTAQMILESGYCGTELALNANNCFGMKKSLSGNTWPGSAWDGKGIYTKKTQEDDGTGHYYTITSDFRKYACVEDSIRDHSAYLLGAMNGSRLRYEGLTECADYRQAIRLIKDGGYATDTRYVSKICSIIERFDLAKYDGGGAEEKKAAWYRVRKSWEDSSSQKGAFRILENAKARADENPGYSVYDPDGKALYTSAGKAVEEKGEVPFLVRVSILNLNIRSGPGNGYPRTGEFTGIGIFTIVAVSPGDGSTSGWGKLKSGAGWIALDYTERI